MKSRSLGPIRIHRVVEIDRMTVPAAGFFPGSSAETIARAIDETDRRFVDAGSHSIVISFHSFVIESGGRRILVDACHGNDKRRIGVNAYANGMRTDYLPNLERQGFRPEDIDIVLCTHLHYDHVGWNTRLENGRWVPTFPNARYVMTRRDFDHFGAVTEASPEWHHMSAFQDSVLPVVEAGLADLIAPEDIAGVCLSDGLRVTRRAPSCCGSRTRLDGRWSRVT